MTDPYFYIQVMLVLNIILLPLYLILSDKNKVDKAARKVLTMAFMAWQGSTLLNKV